MKRLINVADRRHLWIGAWEVEPLRYDALTFEDVGRTVIYSRPPNYGQPEAGTLNSWRDGLVFVRFTQGVTAAACDPKDLVFGVRPLDGDLTRGDRR